LKPCEVITKVLSILLQERFLENVCVIRNHGYLAIIDQRRQAIRRGDVEEYRRLAGPRRKSLKHDKQQWMEQIARTGENHLLRGEIKDAFALFPQLKQKCATSAPLKVLDGKLLSDRASVAARWQEHFSTLLNRPTQSPPDALVSEAQASTPDSTINTFPPTINH